MVICIEQWRARIGLFVARSTKGKFKVYNDLNIVNYKIFALIIMLLLIHGDIENNPGPKRRTSSYFSCCHWNVNSIMAHNKLSLLSTYNTLHKFDVICISETYLDKSADNDALSVDGYNVIRVDHPHNQKRSGACIYFKKQLKLKQVITPNFSECILCAISMGNKIGYIAVTYRYPSQTASEFANLLENFEKLLYQIQQFRPSFVVILMME